jgi:hypothetical protein
MVIVSAFLPISAPREGIVDRDGAIFSDSASPVNGRDFFGTLCADFGILCPFRSHICGSVQNVRAKKARIYRGLLARPKRFELLTPRFVVWCSIPVVEGPAVTAARKNICAGSGAG